MNIVCHSNSLASFMDFDNRMLSLVHRMADAAGEIARGYWRMPLESEQKADASPVTIADREIEAAMREMIEHAFPEHGIIGEEHGNTRPGAEYQWVLDPIDGTRAFIAGLNTFTTLIALVRNGAPVMGVIDQPITRERWVGISGHASTLNGKPIKTGAAATLAGATVSTTSTYHFSEAGRAGFEKLRQATGNCLLGGDAYAYGMLACGHIDLVIDEGMKPYDFCALAPVIAGAGGAISDWQGKPLTLASDGRIIAAANPELLREALGLLVK